MICATVVFSASVSPTCLLWCHSASLNITPRPDDKTLFSASVVGELFNLACVYQQINFDKLRTPLATSMNISLCNAPANCTWSNNRTTNWLSFPEEKNPWLGGGTLSPGNEQVPVTECPLKPCARSCDTMQGLYVLAGMVLFVDCFICSKDGRYFISTSYLLSCPDNPLQNAGLPSPHLWILYFLVTVHFTAFNSTF